MYNWSIDEERFKKENPEEYRLWRLTQLINYGLDGEKLSEKEVKEAWPKIKNKVDRYKRRFVEFLLTDELNNLSSDSPVIENNYQKVTKVTCPMCRYQDAVEKGLISEFQ